MDVATLETKRLLLRKMKNGDAKEIFDNWTSDHEVAKYMRWDVHVNIDTTIDWVNEVVQCNTNNQYLWVIEKKDNNQLIGAISITINNQGSYYEAGYNIMKAMWNKGYASEAMLAVIEFSRDMLGLKKLYCMHATNNIASKRVIEKCGFIYHGETTYTKFDGVTKVKAIGYYLDLTK